MTGHERPAFGIDDSISHGSGISLLSRSAPG
jgi:hypothetical protein